MEKEKQKLLSEIFEYDRVMEIQHEQLKLKDKQISALKVKNAIVANNNQEDLN